MLINKMDANELFLKLTAGTSLKRKRISAEIPATNESTQLDPKKVQSEKDASFLKKHKIKVKGKNPPPPIKSFDELGQRYSVNSTLLSNLKDSGYETPTPIQMQSIPALLDNRHVFACAPTGSGKTVAYLLPILANLGKPDRSGFRALILCPTRELARQIFRECTQLAENTGLIPHLIKKVKTGEFGPNFSKKFDILVTTPNRFIYLLKQENSPLNPKNVKWLIVDESDKLFEVGHGGGFREQLAEIYKSCDNPVVRRAMFSATYTDEVAKWCKKTMKNILGITVGRRNTTVDSVAQELIYVGNEVGKLTAIRDLIHKGLTPPVLVFVQTKERAKQLFTELIYDGLSIDAIHSDRTELQRDNVVKAFREGKIWVLICTELMGRGIDFIGIKLVINYDFPPTAISYIHRIGRAGRSGRSGRAITYFTDDDIPTLRSIATVMKESGCSVPEYMLSINKRKQSKRKRPKVPDRKPVTTGISFEKHRANRLKAMKEHTKKRKKNKEAK